MARRIKNEGTIYRRENGYWRAQYSLNGRRVSFTAQSQKECLDWVRRMQEQSNKGLTYENATVKLAIYLDGWLQSKKGTVRNKTLEHYQRDIENHIIPILGRIKVVDLRPFHIQGLYDQKLKEGIGIRSVGHLHSTLRQAMNHAMRIGVIYSNPCTATSIPKVPQREMLILDEGEVQSLLITAQQSQPELFALYYMAINTGLRQSELLGLKWSDLDEERSILHVRRQVRFVKGRGVEFSQLKTKSSVRSIRLGITALDLLWQHRFMQNQRAMILGPKWEDNEMIFPTGSGKPSYSSILQKRFKVLLKQASLKRIRFHDLRHTAASLMLKHNIPIMVVSRRLGHSKPSITLDVYGHLLAGMQEDAARVMDEVMTPVQIPIAPKLHRKPEF